MTTETSDLWSKQLSKLRRNLIEDHQRVYLPCADFTSLSWRHIGGNKNNHTWILRFVEFDLTDYDTLDEEVRGLGRWINGEARKDILGGLVDDRSPGEDSINEERIGYGLQQEITSMVVLARVSDDNPFDKTITLQPIREHPDLADDFDSCIHLISEVTMLAGKHEITTGNVVGPGVDEFGRLVIQSESIRCEIGAAVELSFTVFHTFIPGQLKDTFRAVLESIRIVNPTTLEQGYVYTHYY
ncbi:hypothetical protein V5O48_007246 [Marasmius crinis-equi]|uniref:Uncharacterized protein n=1 Tax=Marasmius crinis-equi TaxID=585013 RepID=A0ABR3FH91_9AGAR